MTVSYFAALEAQIPAVEARHKMDMAEAAMYPTLTKPEHARDLWAHWMRQANPPPPIETLPGGSTFYWNNVPIEPAALKSNLAGALGSGLSA